MDERFVNAADGVSLFAAVYGTPTARRSLVCIPGLTRNSRDFTELATDLAVDRLVVAVDLRGRGRSGYAATAESYRLDIYADDVLRVIHDLGLAPVVVVGTSLGGLIAMRLAAHRPDQIAGIVLNDIGPEIIPAGLARIASYAGKLAPVRSWDEAAAQCRMVSEAALPGLSDQDWLDQARQRYRPEPDGTFVVDHDPRITAGPPSTDDPWAVFAALEPIPLLVVRGALSDILAEETVETMRAILPRIDIVTLTDRGHAPTLDEPAARVAISRYLAQIDG
ncbi:MAG TPA: alpha/beta hydrolase [Acidimicrobiales bacterium]|jgi:pimeloyl-ACP methyl ester carboxylesterase